MSHSDLGGSGDLATLQYIVTHVFCPLQLPGGDDRSIRHECSLVETIATVLRQYDDRVEANIPRWHSISRMLDNMQAIVQFESLDRSQTVSQLIGMDVGDILAFHIRAQNVAVLFRKQKTVTIFESFEVSPKAEDVMTTQGKLICSYPGPAIEIPNATFEDEDFLYELANFLVHMHDDILDAAPTSRKAQSTVLESRDTAHPRYITELLTGILRSVGRPADIVRITKRVGDDVLWNNSKLPWRRSSLWLLIRVVIQTSLDQPTPRHDTYKQFMLFFMCRLANEKIGVDLPNDILQFMSAKISRRLRKLGSSAPQWLSRTVLRTCTSLRSILENRWKQVQAVQRASPIWVPSQLDLTRDVELSLLGSRAYIHNRLTDRTVNPPDTSFTLTSRLRGSLDDFLSFDGAFFEQAYHAEPHVALYDIERAVEQGLDGWVDQVTNNDGACVMLEILGNKYSSGALDTYGNNPELLSVTLLTTIELWVALDKIAIKQIPMLADYSPEVPTSLLEDLLLCKTASLSRLRRLHEYLSRRHSQSKSRWSVFSSTIGTNTFGVRYYGESSRLQSLKSRIEETARRDVDKKVAQLEKTNAHYATLKQKVIDSDHASAITQDGREFHPKKCQKCNLERRLARMDIAIHEWPLPAGNLQAEVVVFELDCPVSFNMWRTATLRLLVDLCSLSPKPKDPFIKLDQYGALQPYLVQHPRSRISLGSDTKPFAVTHYSRARIPATQKRVCVNNGLSFYGFDSRARVPVSEALVHVNARRFFTYGLERGPYQNLQKYIDATSHTSNAVLANQVDCHKDLSIHEYLAFGHLRSGGLLQWLNILRNLRDRSLTFRRPEVHSLIAQAVSQVGPPSEEGWTWHEEIREPSFCYALIAELESLLGDVKANWLEGVTMDTISFLLRRLLTSSTNRGVSEKVLGLLRTMRQKVFSWVMDLSEKLAGARGDEELRGLLRDTAAICRSTFDFDPTTIRAVLCCAEDVEILLSSAIFIHDNTPGNVSSLSAHSRLLLDRDRRLSLTLESALNDIIRTPVGDQGIDRAIRSVWPLYRPGSKWKPPHTPNSSWFSCATASTTSQCSQVVSFHLLDGSLLVDGKPLGRLPDAIVRHPLYNLIFGGQLLDVTPADLPGMDYSTRDMISDHQVYFSLKDDDLIIRAKGAACNISKTIELIPHEQLKGDLPEVFIEGHAHWLNLSTFVLEIRPLDKLWESSSDNWSIDCTTGRYRMRKGCRRLVDIRSPTWAMISGLLEPLDSSQNLIISVSTPDSDSHQPHSSSRLSVDLPRYGLSFFVDEDGNLQSRNIRGMVYDDDQSIRTMFGLVNQLVLRPKSRNDNGSAIIPRYVLIPEGDISFQKDSHHVRVEIDIHGSALRRITYQTYRVDTDLGCLTGNVSLTNKLYCAYLHALTSGCGTEPLTGRSGTEEALSLLRSAGCWSIMKFEPREAELLALIASICPSRTWYPEHLKCMQKVEWRNLPASTQHHDLYVVANGIKEHCERVLSFQENQSSNLFESFPLQHEHLLERSALRAAYLFPSESSEQPSAANFDVRYQGRDVLESSSGEHRAYAAATAVYYWTVHTIPSKYIKNLLKGWKDQTVSGKAPLSLQYDRSWLNPNLPSIWLEAYNLLRECDEGKWTQLFFSLPAMAYTSAKFSDLVPVFVAFATDPRFGLEDPPPYDCYNMSDEDRPSESTLRSYVFHSTRSFEDSPEYAEPATPGESSKALRMRQLKMYNDRLGLDADVTTRQFFNAWPSETPPWCHLNPDVYDVATLMSRVENDFSNCYRNLKLKDHLSRVQTILNNVHSQAIPSLDLRYSFQPSQSALARASWSPTVDQLLARPAPSLQSYRKSPRYSTGVRNTSSASSAPLNRLIGVVEATADNQFQRKYVSVLRNSADSFGQEKPSVIDEAVKRPATEKLMAHYIRCRVKYLTSLDCLRTHLGPISQTEQALEQAGQWPRVTAHVLLRFLASNSPVVLSDDWKRCLTRLAMLMLELQRARRLFRLHLDGLHEEFCRESENEGCNNFAVEEYPDWLLIQLQGNFLIRRVQVDVANEMILPSSGMNTAMQLNMGEGKSSVIVPISVAALADGDQVVRVIVPKALTAQMFQLLVDRLGGLANRRIYYIPFSRSLDLNPQQVVALFNLFAECMRNRGILVVQPEHVLSLKLVSVEKQLSRAADDQVPDLLLELQKWLHSHSRDILDESDEILHVRYQLVYTIGLQQHMEGFPERWTTTQQVLGLVGEYAPLLAKMSPFIECERGPPGSFPHFRILRAHAGQGLISWLVQTIMDGRLPNFNFQQYSLSLRNAIQIFIRRQDVPPIAVQLVKERFQHTPLWGGLLLLRGLLATGILLFAFTERRWRVDYGLAPTRTMLAVPYRAKDVPAQRAEFGHPDVAIILTCLSYYYGGLTDEQLRASFEILLKQDDPSLDYGLWVIGCRNIPEELRTLNGINIKSSEQWQKHLLPQFSRNKATIDFYLSRVVYPREAKEFPSKLSCSGWDLAEQRERLLTGFSGTNDGQYLLPLHIAQHDPKHQQGTNAKVLAYLLQPENNSYMCTAKEYGGRRTTREFLKIMVIQKPEIRVLLDVGAQMLDLQNHELAKEWLAISPGSSAAIYFNEDDELTVLTRDGGTQLLLSSPFAQQLDQCVIYLDDAHTRGTDINFPSGFRAAVTLGPKVTKDRLAQGCMRMRKLGRGHSVMFFAPLEVDRRICHVDKTNVINAMDILQWAIRETWEDIQQRAPHWAQQGSDHTSRYAAWTSFCRGELSSEELSDEWLQPEAKRLEDLYGPRKLSDSTFLASSEIRRRCNELGAPSLSALNMDEEQEREVVHEAERERQIERPPKVPPATHSVHPDVVIFAKTGVVPPNTKALRPAFESLNATSGGFKEVHVWSPNVLVTTDFEKTVKPSSKIDDYLRPVMWVASGKRAHGNVLVILSPYEANHLLPVIRSSDKVHLHVYTPRTTKSMKSCDDLALYTIPNAHLEWTPSTPLMDQLNVFAGQVYLKDYKTYIRLCRFLCVYARDLQCDKQGIEVGSDGFILPWNRPKHLRAMNTFQNSPLDSLKILMALRRKGTRFAPTHIGRLVDGQLLSEDDFDDRDESAKDH
ncbi:hypothetical protein L210DRAFT_3540646 [Boletus edulis BED1]|uniref:ubiquitinyl hydrolase 1 n=1 Tax=Boletus edulis BED1 TaxID=1328754 RepID=A0AAD4BUL3_BOLED|nr:hypothetical protein L210DRAFT_3540646 [Boletus edulis BED1]